MDRSFKHHGRQARLEFNYGFNNPVGEVIKREFHNCVHFGSRVRILEHRMQGDGSSADSRRRQPA
jgi:hypothetical protein